MLFAEKMRERTKTFALRTINLFRKLPRNTEAEVIGKQMLRSGTSAAANYRAACRSRSTREFYAKLSIVIEELDESLFWMELLTDAGIIKKESLDDLSAEGEEILKILSKARKTTKTRT